MAINPKRFYGYLATGTMPESTALDESLLEHDKRYHGGNFDPKTMKCGKRDGMALGDNSDFIITEGLAETKYREVLAKGPAFANARTDELAPNGNRSNLSNALYHLVRTKQFKDWFGDWERKARVEKLRNDKSIDFKWNGEYELNRNSARSWALNNLRRGYTNDDTREVIGVFRDELRKVTSHGTHNEAHLKSIAAIPHIIKNSIFIDERPNTKNKRDYDTFRYYVTGINIDGVPYTAKVVVGVKDGKKYYDHDLTQIEKGTLIDHLSNRPRADKENSLYGLYDTKLSDILQVGNVSKVVDENGEPMVVYRGTPIKNIGNVFMYGKNFYGGNRGFWFTPSRSRAESYSQDEVTGEIGDLKAVFLNCKSLVDMRPLKVRTDYKTAFEYLSKNFDKYIKRFMGVQTIRDIYTKNQSEIYNGKEDGVVLFDEQSWSFIAKLSEQIKSADSVTYDDAGNVIPPSQRFNKENLDIRY